MRLKVDSYSLTLWISLFSICLFSSVLAEVPVILSGPVPAIAKSYAPGSTSTVVYTITNNVPKSLPISLGNLFAPLARTTVSNDCGAALPKGPSQCQIGIVITPSTRYAGQTIRQTLSINYQSRQPLTAPITFSIPAVPMDPVLIAVGQDFNVSDSQPPLLAVSNNHLGTDWTLNNTFSGLSFTPFLGASCTGTGVTASCAVVGRNNASESPIIVLSTDGAADWSLVPPISGLTTRGLLMP